MADEFCFIISLPKAQQAFYFTLKHVLRMSRLRWPGRMFMRQITSCLLIKGIAKMFLAVVFGVCWSKNPSQVSKQNDFDDVVSRHNENTKRMISSSSKVLD